MPPLCPLACAVALLPVDFAFQQLVRVAGMQPLASLFEESHPVLGRRKCDHDHSCCTILLFSTREHPALVVGFCCDALLAAGAVVKLERCVECQRLKSILTEANRRVQTARIEMTQAAEANASTDIAKSQEEFDTLKAESLAANALLADHVDATHPRAEVCLLSVFQQVVGLKTESHLLW
eukprot:COSAG02_NODE_942_length_15746_cov_6.164632_5_plen_180_part_00